MRFPPSTSKIITQQPANKTASKYDCLTVPNTATRARLNKGLPHITDFHHIPGEVVAWIPEGMRQQQKRLKSQVWLKKCWVWHIFPRWLWFGSIRPLAREAPPPLPLRLRSSHQPKCLFGELYRQRQMPALKRPRSRTLSPWGLGDLGRMFRLGTSSYFKLRQQRSGHELEDHRLHRLQTPSPW